MAIIFENQAPHAYPCPHCAEEVNASMTHCQVCRRPLHPEAAGESAQIESRISQAFSDANTVWMTGGGTITFTLVAGLVLVRLSIRADYREVAVYLGLGLLGLAVVIAGFTTALAVRWFARFGRLALDHLSPQARMKTEEDVQRSRTAVVHGVALGAGTVLLAAGFAFVLGKVSGSL